MIELANPYWCDLYDAIFMTTSRPKTLDASFRWHDKQ